MLMAIPLLHIIPASMSIFVIPIEIRNKHRILITILQHFERTAQAIEIEFITIPTLLRDIALRALACHIVLGWQARSCGEKKIRDQL
jgi:hypothetical protein